MALSEDEVYCRGCGELLYRILRHDDGATTMKDPGVRPQTDAAQEYFRCPTCRGKNLAALVEDPPGSCYYAIIQFTRG